jgi:hypothetical protein
LSFGRMALSLHSQVFGAVAMRPRIARLRAVLALTLCDVSFLIEERSGKMGRARGKRRTWD